MRVVVFQSRRLYAIMQCFAWSFCLSVGIVPGQGLDYEGGFFVWQGAERRVIEKSSAFFFGILKVKCCVFSN